MAVINVLDKHTAELIAAGEVVERPASVIKELTENSIDAGATAITVSIERGGISCMQISDNGSGIEAEYIPTAFIRHATSKIKAEDDLEHICTLGFRGEALASIASVAKIELLTRTPEDEFAYLYCINGGVEKAIEPAARPVGTTITVRDLFYNTPARMKFLKKDTSEANYVSDIVAQLALSHPEIAFKFIKDGKLQFQTAGDDNLRATTYSILSRDFAKELVDVVDDEGMYTVTGCVTPPKNCRASRSMQYFFINNRYVKNRTMMAALEAAYKGTLMQGKFPGGVLFLKMPPELVDVNVHPAKTEVRFARERDVFEAVYKAVKGVLLTKESTEKTFEFKTAPLNQTIKTNIFEPENKTAFNFEETQSEKIEKPQPFYSAHNQPTPVEAQNKRSFTPVTAKPSDIYPDEVKPFAKQVSAYSNMLETLSADIVVPYDTEGKPKVSENKDYFCEQNSFENDAKVQSEERVLSQEQQTTAQLDMSPYEEPENINPLRFVGEAFNTYIITQRGNNLCLIDKHAAHERIIYETLLASYGNVSSQMLLCPVTVRLSAQEKNALLQNEEMLNDIGVEVEDFGTNAVIVRAVPADIVPDDIETLIIETANRLIRNPKEATSEKTQWVMHSIACRAAIKGGDKTNNAQLISLAQDVLDDKIPPFCPHGRPVVIQITKKELEKQFGR